MLGHEEVHEYHEGDRPYERYTGWRRTSWAAIFAGLFVALTIFLTLQVLGAGIGLATIDLTGRRPSDPTELGIGTAVWWFITGIIALFAGGWVAGRLGWLPNKIDRILHGLTVWAAFYIVMVWLVTTALSTVVGGGLSLLGQGASAVGQVAAGTAQAVSPEMIQEEIGTTQQGQQAGQDLVTAITNYFRGPQTAQERQQLAQVIAQSTGVSEAQANETISNLEQKVAQAVPTGEEAAQAGEQAANIAGTTFIVLAIAMILDAVAAALGGLFTPEPKYARPYGYGRTRRVEAETYAAR